MVLNTTAPIGGAPISTIELLSRAGYPIATSGQENLVCIRPRKEAQRTSWGEIIHLRHHPGRLLTVFADMPMEVLEVLAYEFHLWEIRESFRNAKSGTLRKS
ncbi:MAG: hypothetical protein ABSH34_21785 [Verrucomicrobiota bacterium]|jgi:hypothetical protein